MTRHTCKALLIDAERREIRPVTYDSLEAMQKLVGGYIECAYQWPKGDVLYVDEEGLGKDVPYFDITVRPDQILAGNGLIVGREIDEDGNTADPIQSADTIRRIVRFLGRV